MINLLIFIAFVGVALILGFGVASFPLISPDEPRYAETAREMLERLDFIVPFCGYEPRYDKPILFYWFELLFFKTLGNKYTSAVIINEIIRKSLFTAHTVWVKGCFKSVFLKT